METQVQTDDAILQKTQELCATIVQQQEFQALRRQIDSFMADSAAQKLYESLDEKGRELHHKQHQGQELSQAEITAFDRERETLLANPVARGFVDAQESLHRIQQEINRYVSKTFELGRLPVAADLEEGSCGHGCGCHH